MFLSFFLIMIFLVFTLSQIYFLGKYFSIKQEAFLNQKFAILPIGFIFYIFITFAFISPFYFFSISSSYINIIFAIKDIFIVLFLISKRDVFRNNKFNILHNIIFIFISIIIVIFYKYVISKINGEIISIENNDNDFILPKINNYVSVLTFSKSKNVLTFFIWPLLSIGIVFIILSFYSMIIKSKTYLNYFISFFTIIILVSLFNYNFSFEMMFSFIMLVFLFQIGINVIIYSRRRYSTLYGFGVISVWFLNSYTSLVIIILSICLVFAYGILKRFRPFLFAVQLISPITFALVFWIKTYSKIISIILVLIILIIYISLFYFARFTIIESNPFINKLNFLIPILIFIILFIYSLVKIISISNNSANFLWNRQPFLNDFNNKNWRITINIIYYILFLTTISYSLFTWIFKKRIIGINLIFFISSLIFIMFYNPFIQEALIDLGISKQYYINNSMITIVPILMILLTLFIERILKFVSKNFDSGTKIINVIKSIRFKKI